MRGILTLLAGGTASEETQAMVARDGIARFASGLSWLGTSPAELEASRQVVWESDPFARGGYAYFDPSFDPALREWLARPCRPPLLRGRAHQHPLAGLHERRGRERPPRGRGNRRDPPDRDGL